MIQFKNISKTFHKSQVNEVKALQNINLKIPKSEFLVLVGSNGSGKSTLLNALAGSFKVDQGEIILEGQSIQKLKDYQRSIWIARVFQNPLSGTAPDLSILDNFRLASLRTKAKSLKLGLRKDFQKEVQEKIALLNMGLEDKLSQKMGSLSGGQRQALTLIMAIMDEAKLLLMDEPTAALDPKSAEILMEKAQLIIRDFQLTSILVTHNLRDAHHYGDRLIQMQLGKIIRDIPSSEKQKLALTDLYTWF